jgi:hypothetical protein
LEKLITNPKVYEACAIPSLNAKVMNYFTFFVIFEELLDVAMWPKVTKG